MRVRAHFCPETHRIPARAGRSVGRFSARLPDRESTPPASRARADVRPWRPGAMPNRSGGTRPRQHAPQAHDAGDSSDFRSRRISLGPHRISPRPSTLRLARRTARLRNGWYCSKVGGNLIEAMLGAPGCAGCAFLPSQACRLIHRKRTQMLTRAYRPPVAVRGFPDFQSAARVLFSSLQQQTGLPAWLMLRIAHSECLVVAALDSLMNIRPGEALLWDRTISARVLRGELPQVIWGPQQNLSAGGRPSHGAMPVCAHVCVPMRLECSATGCLVGFDIATHDKHLASQLGLVTMAASVLATLWAHEVRTTEATRRAERAELESTTDPMTGAYNRRGWKRLLRIEESRCARTKAAAGVIVFDLDYLKRTNDEQGHGAGDDLIARAAQIVRGAIRPTDALARLGGDEFAVLLSDTAPAELVVVCTRIKDAFAEAGISATFGYSWRGAGDSLTHAQEEADAALIRAKAARPRGTAAPVARSEFALSGDERDQ